MPFVEIQPVGPVRGIGTGVRLTMTEERGLRFSLAGDALAALGGRKPSKVRVLIDRDPGLPRLRLVRDDNGPFALQMPPRGDTWMLLNIGKGTGLPDAALIQLHCTWERVDGQFAIDIDLPREMRVTSERVGTLAPSTSTAKPKPRPVTLAGRAGAEA